MLQNDCLVTTRLFDEGSLDTREGKSAKIREISVEVQFVTPTSQFTPFESNGLVYKPHPRFLTQNFGKKVRLIHEFLRYVSS